MLKVTLVIIGRERVNMILALVLPTKRSTFWSFSFGTLLVSISKRAHTQTLTSMVGTTSALRREHEQEFSK